MTAADLTRARARAGDPVFHLTLTLFRKEGELWHLRFTSDDRTEEGHYPNEKGFIYYSYLINNPRKMVLALQLYQEIESL
ncbi:MAG: hypothetical protein QOD62_336, partial [Actinomycetota bacterium]|nr:hypothetical protein [Actinomycetota bacterium]